MRPVYESTDGVDGYVSLEVNPKLAYDTEGTVMEARRLSSLVDRPNVMIKVPATEAGVPAVRQLIGEGLNINVTLMFSRAVYEAVADAYISGLEDRLAAGGDVSGIASVSSFFISRIDTLVDALLAERAERAGDPVERAAILDLTGRTAFGEIFSGPRWEELAAEGARVQRPLWGSTSTKNPDYPDTLYVDTLMGPHTVNTVPPETLDAFLDHGCAARTVDADVEEARQHLAQLAELGIDLGDVGHCREGGRHRRR